MKYASFEFGFVLGFGNLNMNMRASECLTSGSFNHFKYLVSAFSEDFSFLYLKSYYISQYVQIGNTTSLLECICIISKRRFSLARLSVETPWETLVQSVMHLLQPTAVAMQFWRGFLKVVFTFFKSDLKLVNWALFSFRALVTFSEKMLWIVMISALPDHN